MNLFYLGLAVGTFNGVLWGAIFAEIYLRREQEREQK